MTGSCGWNLTNHELWCQLNVSQTQGGPILSVAKVRGEEEARVTPVSRWSWGWPLSLNSAQPCPAQMSLLHSLYPGTVKGKSSLGENQLFSGFASITWKLPI